MSRTPHSLLPEPELGTPIPKIIHQTYGSQDMPEALQRNVADLKAMNAAWDYRFYDDAAVEAFITEHYGPDILARYLRIDPSYGAARADLFRYLAVYHHGGVYLDIKSRFLRPIDEVIHGDEGFIVAQWSNGAGEKYEGFGLKPEVASVPGGEFQQWHVIAAPGHPFLHAVISAVLTGIDRYRPWRDGTGKVGVMRLTGPMLYTLTIAPLMTRYPCKFVAKEAMIALDYSIVSGDSHRSLFKAHYKTNEASIVTLPGHLRLVHTAYRAGRDLKRKLGGR
jgi:inositol phosphorylceramide mannosyltransferase catalytic subunit